MSNQNYCYVRFKVESVSSFDRLAAAVSELSTEKEAAQLRSMDNWKTSFTSEQLGSFWSPDEEEMAEWDRFWFSTPLPFRHSAEMPSPGWNFESMIAAIIEGDYDLLGVELTKDGEGLLKFYPHGYPYGGVGSLSRLVRAFGHELIGTDGGFGFEPGDPEPSHPLWRPAART